MKSKVLKIIWVAVFVSLFVTGIWLYESEEYDRVPPIEEDGNYQIHMEKLVPRESPDILIAEDGRLFLFYIETELVAVYTTEGEYLYGIQFPDGQNGRSDMCYVDGLLYVDARMSGIYVFQDSKLLRFEEQHYQNEGHHELGKVFEGKVDHEDGGYTYSYTEDTDQIIRFNGDKSEIVIQFPREKFNAKGFLIVLMLALLTGRVLWGEKRNETEAATRRI